MRKMGISGEMSLYEAAEYYPIIVEYLKTIGVCCVNEQNCNLSMEEICRQQNVDAESFLEALNQLI